MKRIEFISPVEALRGNISGSQKLVYAENNNPAWDAPEGKNYARNYTPRFVGAKRAKDGLKYFSVRTKHCAVNDLKTRTAQALIGGVKPIYDALAKDLNFITTMQEDYLQAKDSGRATTYFSYWTNIIRDLLKGFADHYAITSSLWILNPWYNSGQYGKSGTSYFNLPDTTIVVKFWKQLRRNGITFEVANVGTGIAVSEQTFADVLGENSGVINSLELDTLQVQEVQRDFVGFPSGSKGFDTDMYLMLGGAYVVEQDIVHADGIYTLTDVVPTE